MLVTFNLLSANAVSLVTSKILSFGKGLILNHDTQRSKYSAQILSTLLIQISVEILTHYNLVSKIKGQTFNPLPSKPWFLHVCSTSLLKTLLEKKKLLITSNFSSFSQCFLPFCRTFHHFHQI